ncbi:hypothetical protein [Antarcticirhabdus aurantiaca]|uniref:Uncharacterized protein n=1 Tax=Antarcticirhabdus aurantiaca TaxID=2606717 RepID=A0ACD4NR82_9HYPH|nr:hypothetical protein OXU80_03610 [Jeongeuplla avenae]
MAVRLNPRRIKILAPNLVYKAEISGGSWQPGDLSLDALHDPLPGRVARSTSASPSASQMVLKLDRPRQVGGVVLVNHSMTTAGLWIVQAFRDEALTDCVYNPEGQATEAYPRLFRTRDLPWSHPNWWSGKPLAEDIGRVTTGAILLLGRTVTARWWKIQLIDPTNPKNVIDVGKVLLGPVVDLGVNYVPGAALAVIDESTMSQSMSGARFFRKGAKRRRFVFGFSQMREAEVFAKLFDLTAELGITEEFFLIPNPLDTTNLQRRSFVAHLKEPTALEQVALRRLSASFIAEELI